MQSRRAAPIVAASAAGLAASVGPAAAAAPSLVVFGAYFPAWLLCALLGVVGALAVRALLRRVNLDEALPAKIVVYLAFAILIGVGLWRLWYGGGPA